VSAAVPADQEHRDRARLELSRNAVVEAGAGTGKTTLLTDRLLFQLLAGKEAVEVTALVALTFTEKAAAEIKVRLADKLSEAAAGSEKAARVLGDVEKLFGVGREEAARLARRALEDLDKAQIGTIHSFAAHVLRLFPVEAGVDPGFSVDEGPFFEELFESEWAAFLDEELGERPPREAAWLSALRLAPLESLRALAYELCQERLELDAVGRPDPAAAERLLELAEQLETLKSLPPPSKASKILESIDAAAARLRAVAKAASARELALPEKLPVGKLKESSWPKAWEEYADSAPLYEKALECANAATAEGEALVRHAAALVRPFARRFRRAYARRGFVSFDGLLRRARDLVRDHPAAREELKRRYAALFIDEFQDTDPLQGEFLMFLAEAPGRSASKWENAKLGAGRLFVVGDPKQSIYRFRGADIAAYQRFTQRILAEGKTRSCDLQANFRSPLGLIGPVNAVFEELMLPLEGLQAPYKPLLAGGDPAPVVELAVSDGPGDAAQARRREAAFIADWLAANCGEGKKWALKDAAILARTARPFTELIDALRERGVAYAIETERGFYGSPEVLDLANLLRALDDPEDQIAIAGLLRSPLALLEDQALYALAGARGLDYRKKAPAPRAEALFSQLRSLRARVGRLPVGEVVGAVLRETNLLELSARAYHGAQTVANLTKFSRLAAQASDERGLTLKEFVAELLEQLKDPKGEGESPLADEHLEAVRILTIHKSKGLEFPVVFLTNASGKGHAGAKAKSVVDWASGMSALRLEGSGAASAAMACLEPQEKERQRHELLRLLYVALTRAKKRLFIVGAAKPGPGSLSELLLRAGAWPQPDAPGERVAVGAFQLPVTRIAPPAAASAPRAETRARREGADAAALAEVRRRRLEAEKALAGARWTTSPTAELGEPDKAPRREEEDGPRGSPVGALVGRLCHKVLEGADFARPPRGAALEEAVAAAAAGLARLTPEGDWAAARAEAALVLAGFLASPAAAALARVEIVGRELPFCRAVDSVVVRGQLDLLYRGPDGALVVADYKTEPVTPERVQELRAKYELQGRAYRDAVKAARGEDARFALIFLRRPDLSVL
jgi:ATP-dependent helicase/nuclease subunit A